MLTFFCGLEVGTLVSCVDMSAQGTILHGTVRCGMARYVMARYGVCGTPRYGTARYGTACLMHLRFYHKYGIKVSLSLSGS